MSAFCEVALPVPLDHTFIYGVRLGQQPQRGARVIAPFRNEKLIGVVTALAAKPPADVEVKYLEAVLDEEPLLSDHLLELAEWIAQYYLAPLGEVLRAMLPLAAEVRRTVYYRLTDLGRDILARSMDGDQGKGIAAHVRRMASSPMKTSTWSAVCSNAWPTASRSKSRRCAPQPPPRFRYWPPWRARSGSPAKLQPPSAMRGAWSASPS
ncbi:MAG: hypothetical protein ACLQDA_01575 [Terracidiphilus sp.]